MKKNIVLLLISFILIGLTTFTGCTNEKVKLNSIISNHLESTDISIKVIYPEPVGDVKYFEYNNPYFLTGYLELINLDKEITCKGYYNTLDRIEKYISKKTNEKSVFLYSHIENDDMTDTIKCYITEDSKIIIVRNDDKLYESSKNTIDYNQFVQFEKLFDVIGTEPENYIVSTRIFSYFTGNEIDEWHWYDQGLDKISLEEVAADGRLTQDYLYEYSKFIYAQRYKDLIVKNGYILKVPYNITFGIIARASIRLESFKCYDTMLFYTDYKLWCDSTGYCVYEKKDNKQKEYPCYFMGKEWNDYHQFEQFVYQEEPDVTEMIEQKRLEIEEIKNNLQK